VLQRLARAVDGAVEAGAAVADALVHAAGDVDQLEDRGRLADLQPLVDRGGDDGGRGLGQGDLGCAGSMPTCALRCAETSTPFERPGGSRRSAAPPARPSVCRNSTNAWPAAFCFGAHPRLVEDDGGVVGPHRAAGRVDRDELLARRHELLAGLHRVAVGVALVVVEERGLLDRHRRDVRRAAGVARTLVERLEDRAGRVAVVDRAGLEGAGELAAFATSAGVRSFVLPEAAYACMRIVERPVVEVLGLVLAILKSPTAACRRCPSPSGRRRACDVLQADRLLRVAERLGHRLRNAEHDRGAREGLGAGDRVVAGSLDTVGPDRGGRRPDRRPEGAVLERPAVRVGAEDLRAVAGGDVDREDARAPSRPSCRLDFLKSLAELLDQVDLLRRGRDDDAGAPVIGGPAGSAGSSSGSAVQAPREPTTAAASRTAARRASSSCVSSGAVTTGRG
jgi:hypothetical protein